MRKIVNKVEKFISENHLISNGARVFLGLSGGPDSVCLLSLLTELGYTVVAGHCNFHLRGEESLRDEAFAEETAKKHKAEWHKIDFDTIDYAEKKGISIEMAARELRYTWFETMRKQTNCEAIAVGHHQDDNVETFMLNIVRSTGIKGACAIQPKNGVIVRPLLCLTRNEIASHLAALHLDYVIDHTNLESIYSRNKIRLDVMPLLTSINASASSNISSTIENLNEVRKIYEASIREAIGKCCSTNSKGELLINKASLLSFPSPISVLHEALSPFGFNKSQLKDVLKNINECGSLFYGSERRLVIDRDQIVVEAPHYPLPKIETTIIDKQDLQMVADANYAYLDADKVKNSLSLRTPLTGDSFAPFGMKGKRKLVSDFLTDKKFNLFDKEHQALLCDGNEIVWIVGLRSSELYRINDNTQRIIVVHCL